MSEIDHSHTVFAAFFQQFFRFLLKLTHIVNPGQRIGFGKQPDSLNILTACFIIINNDGRTGQKQNSKRGANHHDHRRNRTVHVLSVINVKQCPSIRSHIGMIQRISFFLPADALTIDILQILFCIFMLNCVSDDSRSLLGKRFFRRCRDNGSVLLRPEHIDPVSAERTSVQNCLKPIQLFQPGHRSPDVSLSVNRNCEAQDRTPVLHIYFRNAFFPFPCLSYGFLCLFGPVRKFVFAVASGNQNRILLGIHIVKTDFEKRTVVRQIPYFIPDNTFHRKQIVFDQFAQKFQRLKIRIHPFFKSQPVFIHQRIHICRIGLFFRFSHSHNHNRRASDNHRTDEADNYRIFHHPFSKISLIHLPFSVRSPDTVFSHPGLAPDPFPAACMRLHTVSFYTIRIPMSICFSSTAFPLKII